MGGIGISETPTQVASAAGEPSWAWVREPWAIRAGVIAGALTLVLRFVGVVVGPLALVLAIAAIAFLPGPARWSDRFLVAAAAVMGWLPVIGWVPKLGSSVDVEGILLAIVVAVAVAYQVGVRGGPDERRQRITVTELVALGAGALVAIWWAIPFWRQTAAGRLRLLLPSGGLGTPGGWDNPTHLAYLQLNIKIGSFTGAQPNSPAGVRYFGWEYPQGWHQMWAQWVRLWYRHPPTSARSMVDIYCLALVLTAAIAVTLGCVAVARLCRHHSFAALVSMSVVAQVLAVGVMSIAIYSGFPNIGIAVVAVAIAPSILLRPTLRPPAAFFVVSGMMLVGVYNWWPLALLATPTLIVATWRLWQYAGEQGRRAVAAVVIVFAGLAMAAPILLTLHLGTSHVLIGGGIPNTPWWLVFASTFALMAAVAIRQVLTRDTLTSVLFGAPAILGAVGVVALIGYEIASTPAGQAPIITYYGQKLGAAVAAASLIGLALLFADAVSRITPQLRESRSRGVLVALAAVVASVAVFQVAGYVGPRQGTIAGDQAAPGFQTHEHWSRFDHSLDPVADHFLDAVDTTRQTIKQTGELPEQWSYIDIEGLDVRTDWTDYWFAALVGGFDEVRINRALNLYSLHGVTDPNTAASIINQQFPPNADNPLRLVVPQSLVLPLEQANPGWQVGTTLFPMGATG